ncbi:MAG: hypothetical protein DI630_33685 [Gordonia sp. (in: high G+C Gram-positive bacteria)]|nr:MAG: hypothetical protein DI630_33685 [Gordonia sp. (in: high G+C Gram-positive bacteria)]
MSLPHLGELLRNYLTSIIFTAVSQKNPRGSEMTAQKSSYSAPQVSHVGDVRDLTQGSGTYMSDSSTGYGYFGYYSRHIDTPDTVADLPARA